MPTKHIAEAYRGPVRKRRSLFGAPTSNTPIPISRAAARIETNSGIVARFAPGTGKTLGRFDVKSAGSF